MRGFPLDRGQQSFGIASVLVGQRVRVWLWAETLPMESSLPVAEIISVSRFFYAFGSDLQHKHILKGQKEN